MQHRVSKFALLALLCLASMRAHGASPIQPTFHLANVSHPLTIDNRYLPLAAGQHIVFHEVEGVECSVDDFRGHRRHHALSWQVKYHLENQCGPDLSPFTKANENFCRYLEEADAEANKFIEGGKNIERSKFDKKYNPEVFKTAP